MFCGPGPPESILKFGNYDSISGFRYIIKIKFSSCKPGEIVVIIIINLLSRNVTLNSDEYL